MHWKKPLRITTLSCKVGTMRLRPEWPWRARKYKITPDESVQYGIFSCFLLLLPCFSSTCRQTNDDNTRNVSEDRLLFFRIQSLHRFLEVDFHDEEDELISSTLHDRRLNILLATSVLVFVVLLWPLIGMQNHSHSILTHTCSNCTSGISCSLLFKFVTNLFEPWEILTHEWELSLVMDMTLISTPHFAVQATSCNFQHGSNLVFPWIQPFGCDASSSLGRVYSRQAAARNCENSAVSFVMKYCPISTTFRNPASIQNLLTLSCCDNFSIRSPYCLQEKIFVSKVITIQKHFCLDHVWH